MIQIIGYHAFNQSNKKTIPEHDVASGISDAELDMESMILDASINDLSDTDIRFLLAMLVDEGESRMADIALRMEVSPSYASHYKRRLVNQGILSSAGRGKVVFSMPMFKELLVKKYSGDI